MILWFYERRLGTLECTSISVRAVTLLQFANPHSASMAPGLLKQ